MTGSSKCLTMPCDYCCVERPWPKIDPLPTELPITAHHIRHVDTLGSTVLLSCISAPALFFFFLLPFSSFDTVSHTSGRLLFRYLPFTAAFKNFHWIAHCVALQCHLQWTSTDKWPRIVVCLCRCHRLQVSPHIFTVSSRQHIARTFFSFPTQQSGVSQQGCKNALHDKFCEQRKHRHY